MNNRPLSVFGLSLIDSDVHAAPNWAVGGRDVFTQPNVAEANRRNHFTVFDAREAMCRALTGRDSQGNVIAATETERNKYWTTTFRALGDVVHLVQDMGQPQHTRNDPHSGKGTAVVQALLSGHKSIFEEYIEARATGDASYNIDGQSRQWPQLIYTGYSPPTFTQYSDFWSTRNGVSGRGLADYSNRMTTESLFDYFLFTNKTYSLNRFNYDDMADLLIPRAVSYSAGLINYFFRGKIDFVPDPTNAGKYTIKNLGAEGMTDSFTLYYDAVDGNRYPVAGDAPTETWTNRAIGANRQLDNLSFAPPTNPAPKASGEYMLVFKGSMGEEKAENGVVGAVIAKRIQAGGATDYVAMLMPNPVPYRGGSIGVADKGAPSISISTVSNNTNHTQDEQQTIIIRNSAGDIVSTQHGSLTGWAYTWIDGNGNSRPSWSYTFSNYFGWLGNNWYQTTGTIGWDGVGGTMPPEWSALPTVPCSPSYEEILAADQAAGTGGKATYVIASNGETLARLAMDTDGNPFAGTTVWNGDGFVEMFRRVSGVPASAGRLTFVVPEDGVYPLTDRAPTAPTGYPETWVADWNAAYKVGMTRRNAWLKKSSDEFVAALKTGFSPSSAGVTRAELKTGALPPAWEFQIKRDVDVKYDSYAPTNTIGRKTKRTIQYAEKTGTFAETVESDTSADLTQAGVKVTKRVVTLTYQYPGEDGPREFPITGYLTQTVTQHVTRYDDTSGDYLLSQKDVYDTWYIREDTIPPDGIPSTIAAAYLNDRTGGRIGVVLNGAVQNDYNADSALGSVGNPLDYAPHIPAYPAASSTVVAVTPDYIKTWHKDAKIEYLENGIGASTVQNDSALYGVTQIGITPVGLIADGNGTVPAGASLGIFSSGETGTQVEIYGTAVYNFDWQTGALTFNKWKPLHDAGDNEVASKVVNLPAGTVFPINNSIITYKGLHWPDAITTISVRDQSLTTAASPSDKILYELIKAIKAE